MNRQLAATYYRVALLLGLVKGEDVHAWAEQVIVDEDHPPHGVVDLVLVNAQDLSELRHALYPLGIEPEPPEVIRAILGRVRSDLARGRRAAADTVAVLRQMRSMLPLPSDWSDAMAEHINAHMLATAGVRGATETVEAALTTWLDGFSEVAIPDSPL
jgi:hypothetical protein